MLTSLTFQPIVDMSEAGSMVASPVHLTPEEAEDEGKNDGSLASQLAAAIKKRKTKKGTKSDVGEEKDTRSSFRKRWSLRRKSRDKNKGSPSTTRQQEIPSKRSEVEPAGQVLPVSDGIEQQAEVEEGRVEAAASTDKERLLSAGSEGGIQGTWT